MNFHSKFLINLFTIFAVLTSLLGSAVFVTPAYAAGIIVNTATDEDVANAACSLREAIIAANTDTAYNGCSAGVGADTITFAANYTITLASQLPIVTTEITITGNGQTNTIIQASSCNPVTTACAHTYRVLSVPGGNLTLSNLTARNGQVIGDLGGEYPCW